MEGIRPCGACALYAARRGWALTLQSQVSPRDGHRRGSGNAPRAACEEWDAQEGDCPALGVQNGGMENPALGRWEAQLARGAGPSPPEADVGPAAREHTRC